MASIAIGRFHDDDLGPCRRRWRTEQRPPRIADVAREENAATADLLFGFDQDAGGPENVSGIKECRPEAWGNLDRFPIVGGSAEPFEGADSIENRVERRRLSLIAVPTHLAKL